MKEFKIRISDEFITVNEEIYIPTIKWEGVKGIWRK